jgi:hypothetical protein
MDIQQLIALLTGGNGQSNTVTKDGITTVNLSAKGGGSENMKALSGFDQKYLGGGHGGNPVRWGLPAPKAHVIQLNSGKNEVKLLPCSGVDQIQSIQVVFSTDEDKKTAGTAEFKLLKHSMCDDDDDHTFTTTKHNLMDCRTLFVPYKDTFTSLTIHAPASCKLVFN